MLELRSVVEGIAWPAVPNNAGSSMLATLYQLEQSQWLQPQELWIGQRRQLRALLEHACTAVPFYARQFAAEVSRLPADFSPAEFSKLPLLSRTDLQQHFSELRAVTLPPSHGAISAAATSGSTGEPVRFLSTLISTFFWHAFALREHLWHKRDFSADLMAIRFETEPRIDENWFGDVGAGIFRTGRCIVIPASWTFDRQLARILNDKPPYLLGYPNNLLGIFRLAEERGVEMPWLREVRSFGEALTQASRSHIAERWNTRLTDVYSARETGYLALQCPDHDVYHVQAESAVVEIIDDHGNPCEAGEIGRVVVTPLHNFGMPLLRYDIGDYAEVGKPCPCGRGLPVLRQILGRERNVLTLPDGSRRWPTLGTPTLIDLAPIRRFKIVQKTLEDIEIRLIVARPLVESELDALRRHFTDQFGHPFNWKFVFMDEFPAAAGGKFEDFVSEIA